MKFDELAAAGRTAVLSGTHEVESPPGDEANRWGPSVILRPDGETLNRLDSWVSEVLPLVGPGHWATGSAKSAHITVRTLGPRRTTDSTDNWAARFRKPVFAASKAVSSVQFETKGLLLSPISVMLALHPIGEEAQRLAAALEEALGDDGWFEQGRARDIWYLNLVHFNGPIANRSDLAQWVSARRTGTADVVKAETLEAVRWEFDGEQMVPLPLAQFPLN